MGTYDIIYKGAIKVDPVVLRYYSSYINTNMRVRYTLKVQAII